MSDPKGANPTDGSKTSKPFSENEGSGDASPGMAEAPHDRADAVGDADKTRETSKTTQRQE